MLALAAFTIAISAASQECIVWPWADSDYSTERSECHGIAVDDMGNTYVAGWFDADNIVIGGIQLDNFSQNVPGSGDIYVAKIDPDGNAIWAHRAGGDNSDWCWGLAIDNSGNVIITGAFFSTTITFGENTFTNNGLSDMFMVKYDTNGNLLWAHTAGSNGVDQGMAAAFDAWGNAFFGGAYENTVNLGDYTLSASNGMSNGLVVKCNTNGTIAWAAGFGGEGVDAVSDLTTDLSGNVYACGTYAYDDFSFGGSLFDWVGLNDAFVLQLMGNGAPGWCKSFGSDDNELPQGITRNVANEIIVCGEFYGTTVNIGGTVLSNSGIADGFMVKYNNNGNQQWAKKCIGSPMADYAYDITSDDSGDIYVTGNAGAVNSQFGNGITLALEGFYISRYDNLGQAEWVYGYGGDNPSLASWDRGTAVTWKNGIIAIGGFFMSESLLFGSTEVMHTAGLSFTQSFFAQLINGSSPELLDAPATAEICEGAFTSIGLLLLYSPLPTDLQWYQNDEPLEGEIYPSLMIYNADAEDSGTYVCVATNACGSTTSDPFELTVLPQPEVPELPLSEFCETTLTYALPAGSWSGPGVNGSNFIPPSAGAGEHQLTVSVTNDDNCTITNTITVGVYAQPNMGSDSTAVVCDDSVALNLNSLLGDDADASGGWYTPAFVATSEVINPAELGTGTYEFLYFNPDFEPCQADTAFITLEVITCLGVKPIVEETLRIYPNPADEICWISHAGGTGVAGITLHDITGKCIRSVIPQSFPAELLLSDISPGTYWIAVGNQRCMLVVQ